MGESEEFHLRSEQGGQLFQFEGPIITNGDKAEPRTCSFC